MQTYMYARIISHSAKENPANDPDIFRDGCHSAGYCSKMWHQTSIKRGGSWRIEGPKFGNYHLVV